ncbi:hypothetical protein [Bradyrhizobium sp. BR 1432]|uniref:hypothetical protein n=1 Tax=Bradyrhizobium sp. BR 1432 TaxID=3447966 RepID=UPI003EE55CE2
MTITFSPAENERRQPEREQIGGRIAVLVGEVVRLAGALMVDALERLDIAVELTAHCPVGVVVAPFARRGRADLHSAPHQLLTEVDELRDPLPEAREQFGIVVADVLLHALHGLGKLMVAPQEAVRELLHLAVIGRHVDAARLHDDRIDQRIDATDVDRCRGRGRMHVTIGRLQAHRLDRHHEQEGGDDRQEAGDAVNLLRDRQRVGAANKTNDFLQKFGSGSEAGSQRRRVHGAAPPG